ncbi:MAG: hypothetical protein HDR94_08305 [Bacteroides sp.]|nr:hypothetical protein [Bacteroides sp.]
MNKKLVFASGLGLAAFALMAKDPIIMTVNGVDVPKSEFEYLYGKNSQQQLSQQPLDEYVEMFKLYKMKVADAKAEGIDTTASFRKEIDQYRRDLASPYLADSVYMNKLLDEMYERAKQEVEARHIMLFKAENSTENDKKLQRLDSVRNALLAGADFAELAAQVSEDRGSNTRGGYMGYITAQQYPYTFEIAAYNTPEGEVSEIVESPVGYHILLGGKHRPASGKVQAAHILKMVKEGDVEADKEAKRLIDSLYNVAKSNPADFADLATRYSDDKGSARQGGMLPWFGRGEMVQPFDSIAFAMDENTICEPFRTRFGWHIINKTGKKGIEDKEQMKPKFFQRITSPQDDRFIMIRDNQTKNLAGRHKGKVNDKVVASIHEYLMTNGLDSAFYTTYNGSAGDAAIFAIDGVATPVKDLVKRIPGFIQPNKNAAVKLFDSNMAGFYNGKLVDAEIDRLEREEPDYRNLYHEYVDGSLLYEISVKKIWDKAAKDTEGLKSYFENHRADYQWSVPHAKGYIVQAANDSIADEVRKLAAETGRDSIVNKVRKTFGSKVSIEKILAEKGSNPMIDNLLFDGPEVKPSKKGMEVYFMIDPRVLTAPEEYTDVRGLVTSDYQNEFQNAWEEELRKKYPVKVNQKVLKSVKK